MRPSESRSTASPHPSKAASSDAPRHHRRHFHFAQNCRPRLLRPGLHILYRNSLPPLRHRLWVDAQFFAQFRERSLRSLYCSSDGMRGRGAPMTNLSHSESFHSRERIAPSNPGIKHLRESMKFTCCRWSSPPPDRRLRDSWPRFGGDCRCILASGQNMGVIFVVAARTKVSSLRGGWHVLSTLHSLNTQVRAPRCRLASPRWSAP